MSENLHNIDDLFKKAIDEHEDTPSLKVWEAIDKNLDKKKVVSISKKYNKLKWVAAVLLLVSFGMAMYTWQTRIKNRELVKQNNINKSSKSNKETINNNEKKSTIPQIKIPSENNNSHQKDEQVNSDAEIKTTKEKDQVLNSSQQKIADRDKEKSKDIVTTQNEKQFTNADKNNKTQKLTNNENRLVKKEETKDDTNNAAEKYIAEAPMIFNTKPELNGIQQIQSSNPFSYKPKPMITDKNVTVENNRNIPAKKKSSKSTKNSLFSATIFFSPEFVSSDVKDDHPRFREDNRNEIKNHENIRSSSSFGILFDYNVANNWKLQSGVSVSTRVTDINSKTIYARPDNGGNVNYRLSCSAGSVYVPLKSGGNPAQGDSTKILSAKNTLQYVSIPLAVKYNIGKGKFNVVPGVGISANILTRGKIETVITTPGGNENSSANNIEGLKKSYLSSQFSLGAEYHLSKKIAVNFTPTARLALSAINRDAVVKTKLNSFGLSAGLTIKL